MAVVLSITKPMEVIQQMLCLFICQFDDWVLIQRDTSTDAVVVRWQQVLQELVIGSKPLYLQVIMCRQVADTIRHRYHYAMQSAEDSTKIHILEIYASEEAYQQHLKTDHFQKYKQGTLHMVKDLKLPTMKPLDPETMKLIFKKQR